MRSKHRLLSIPTIALFALSMACGGGDEEIQIEKPTMGDPAAYFGVEACTCYEYEVTDGSDARMLGVAVERVDDFYSDEAGKDVHAVVYRLGGAVQATYVVDPTNPDLLLTRMQNVVGTGDEWRLTPGMSLAHWLEDRSAMVSTKVQATLYRNASPEGEPQEIEMRTLIDESTTPIRASLDGGETEQDYDARLIQYSQTPWKEPKRWFVPEIGNVQLEFNGARWILHNKRILEGGCPGESVQDICGVNP
ncbi:MAG TPA: hypothetical protein VN033_06785 [Vulgatibacter sp.]|nr:hypothetical protein [Vulgatibacter sp.]